MNVVWCCVSMPWGWCGGGRGQVEGVGQGQRRTEGGGMGRKGKGEEKGRRGHTMTTSVWGSHMLSKFDQPTNLTRYHSLPHLNLESKISSTSYSSRYPLVWELGLSRSSISLRLV